MLWMKMEEPGRLLILKWVAPVFFNYVSPDRLSIHQGGPLYTPRQAPLLRLAWQIHTKCGGGINNDNNSNSSNKNHCIAITWPWLGLLHLISFGFPCRRREMSWLWAPRLLGGLVFRDTRLCFWQASLFMSLHIRSSEISLALHHFPPRDYLISCKLS